MSRGNEPARERAIHAQEAIVRALMEELGHLDPCSPAAAGVRTQLDEESAQVAFKLAIECCAFAERTIVAHRRSRVLIVEQDDGIRTALARWLGEDYDVVTAQDGEEGFALARTWPPDVIVTDLWMPKVDGTSMVSRLKRIESMRTVPVIFLTEQTETKRTLAGISASAIAYLPKPVDLDAVEQALRAALASQS